MNTENPIRANWPFPELGQPPKTTETVLDSSALEAREKAEVRKLLDRVASGLEIVAKSDENIVPREKTLHVARLIRSAPDMLAALIGAEELLRGLIDDRFSVPEGWPQFDAVTAAIAKATGGQA